MPAPTTLLEEADARVTRYQAALDDARTALDTARGQARAAREDARTAAAALAAALAEEAAARSALAAAETEAEVAPLAARLGTALAAARQAEADRVAARDALAEAEVDEALAARKLDRARTRLAAAAADREAATAEADRRARSWTARLGAPPISTLAGDAGDVLTGDWDARRQALEAALPAKLRTAAAKRRELARLRLQVVREVAAHTEDLEDGLRKDSGEPDGHAAPEARAHARAWDALAEVFRRGPQVLDRAGGVLADPVPELSEGETQALADGAADGEAAADLDAALSDALMDLERAERDVRVARLNALADPDLDPGLVTTAENAADAARTTAGNARSAFEADTHPADLKAWEAAVPDAMWDHWLRFLEVTDDLTWLRDDVDPAARSSALDGAEAALAGALDEADTTRGLRDDLDDAGFQEDAREEALARGLDARTRSALKGES